MMAARAGCSGIASIAPVFLLTHMDEAVADMLTAHANDFRPSLRRVEQKGERQPSHAANRVSSLEGSDLILGPCVKTSRPVLDALDASSSKAKTNLAAAANSVLVSIKLLAVPVAQLLEQIRADGQRITVAERACR